MKKTIYLPNIGLSDIVSKIVEDSRNPFIEKEYKFINGINQNFIYLHEKDSHEALKLIAFIQMRPSSKMQVNACYFYNRIHKDGSEWFHTTLIKMLN